MASLVWTGYFTEYAAGKSLEGNYLRGLVGVRVGTISHCWNNIALLEQYCNIKNYMAKFGGIKHFIIQVYVASKSSCLLLANGLSTVTQ